MNNKGQTDARQLQIQGLIDNHLQRSSFINNSESKSGHLDEDSFSAFVEGNLTEREADPIVNHLSDCSYCRHISAELVKLDVTFIDEPKPITLAESEPTKVSEVLGGIMSRIFGAADGAVFAHNETEEQPEDEKEKESPE